MNIPVLVEFIKRRKRRRVRAMMRGYRILKSNGRLGWIRHTKRELADVQMGSINPAASRLFFGAGTENAAQIVWQYVLTRIGGGNLNRALLYSIGSKHCPVSFPLPAEFQRVLIKNGFIVSAWRCSVLWAAYVGTLWCYGILSIVKHMYDALRAIVQPTATIGGPFAYFVGLVNNNLPQQSKDGRSHDILTWYAHSSVASSSLSTVCHGVRGAKSEYVNGKRVEFVEHFIPPSSNLADAFRFGRWALFAVLRSAIDGVRGRWWHALLLTETAKAALVRFANSKQIARDYLFHFSDTIYRPIWTYEATRHGSEITCYFYSTSEEFKLSSGYEPNSSYWKVMNWPRYLVWDQYQEDLVRLSMVGESADIRIVGPIWFNTSAIELPDIPHNAVAVFDIQPIRGSAHFGFSTLVDLDYGNPNVPMKFIQDIYAAVSVHGGTVVHKRKRNDKRFRKVYRRMIEQLSKGCGFISIEPDTSAIRVIEHCRAVVSMPFTSTAILGRHLGKPSAYYDPTGRLQKDDKGAHGIPLLSGKEELQAWVSAVMGTIGGQSLESQSGNSTLPCGVGGVPLGGRRL